MGLNCQKENQQEMTEFKDRRPRMEFFFARFNVRNVFLPRVRRVLDHWFKPLRKRRCFSNPSNWESTLSNSSGRIFSAIFHFLDFNQSNDVANRMKFLANPSEWRRLNKCLKIWWLKRLIAKRTITSSFTILQIR